MLLNVRAIDARLRRTKWGALLTPTLIYVLYLGVCIWPHPLGLTSISLAMWQLLPVEPLRAHPWQSLLFLHSQPPLLNALFAVLLKLEEWTPLDRHTWASLFMIAVGWATCIVWFEVARHLLRSFWLAIVVLILLLTNPGFRIFQQIFFYPPILMLETGLVALAALAYARRLTTRWLLTLMGSFALMTYTWALWHPIFAVAPAGLAGWHRWRRQGSFAAALRQGCVGLLFFGALVAPWMLKNRLLFNESGFSTWLGLNMRNFALGPNALFEFAMHGIYEETAVRAYYTPRQWRWLQDVPAVTTLRKSLQATVPDEINMNHFAVPALNRVTLATLIDGYRERPSAIWPMLGYNVFFLSLPAAYQPYSYDAAVGDYALTGDGAYVRWHDLLYYGSWMMPHTAVDMGAGPVGFNLFATLWLPLALVGGVVRLRKIRTPRGLVWALLLTMEVWLLVVVTAIDATEGARMRWHMEPVFLLLVFQTLREILGWTSAKPAEARTGRFS